MAEATLQDRRILLVEDDYMLAHDMQQLLRKAGAIVIGPVPSVEEALELLGSERLDAAVLDIDLNGEKVFPVAEALAARGIPFLFATGYDASNIPPDYRHITRCRKPVDIRTVARALHSEKGNA